MLQAENEAGIDKVDIVVQVQSVPDAPRNFKASDITPDTCVLKWDRPLSDGGHPILRYNIERRGMGRKTWQRVGTTKNTEFEAENLLEDQTYEFKVEHVGPRRSVLRDVPRAHVWFFVRLPRKISMEKEKERNLRNP